MNRAMRRLQHRCRSRWFSVLGGPDGVEFDVTRETMSSLASPSPTSRKATKRHRTPGFCPKMI
ncbi:hypothetical protein DIPPA_30259 [Diplonema papillatum]|nr:hypothetical protein DIPPA_30259 [Diplonema papillatum]